MATIRANTKHIERVPPARLNNSNFETNILRGEVVPPGIHQQQIRYVISRRCVLLKFGGVVTKLFQHCLFRLNAFSPKASARYTVTTLEHYHQGSK